MEDVRCLKQHLEPTRARLMWAKTSGFTDVKRVSWLRVSAGWGEAPEFGVSRMELAQAWAQRGTFAAVNKQRRSFAPVLGQADKLVSSLVPFCSSPAAGCSACLRINEVVICLKEQLAVLPGELLPPAWWLRCRCQQLGRCWQIKKKNSHRASGDFLTNMLIHTLADWLTLPKYLSFTAIFGRDFTATLVVCDLAHFMHELLWLLLAVHLLTTTAGLQGLTSGHFTWVFPFSVWNKWVFTSHLSAAASNRTLMDFDRKGGSLHSYLPCTTLYISPKAGRSFQCLHISPEGICMFAKFLLNREAWNKISYCFPASTRLRHSQRWRLLHKKTKTEQHCWRKTKQKYLSFHCSNSNTWCLTRKGTQVPWLFRWSWKYT